MKLPLRRPNPSIIPPEGLQQMLDRAPAGSSSIASALTRVKASYEETLKAHRRIMSDSTITPAARTVRAAKTARATLGPALEALAAARANAEEARADLARRAAKTFDFSGDFAATMVAAEIRSHFAASPSDQRLGQLRDAIANGDAVTLKALGAAPAYLSGLPPAMHDAARDALIERHPEAKAAVDAAKSLDEQQAFAELFTEAVTHSTADLIDFAAADSFEAAAREAVA